MTVAGLLSGSLSVFFHAFNNLSFDLAFLLRMGEDGQIRRGISGAGPSICSASASNPPPLPPAIRPRTNDVAGDQATSLAMARPVQEQLDPPRR